MENMKPNVQYVVQVRGYGNNNLRSNFSQSIYVRTLSMREYWSIMLWLRGFATFFSRIYCVFLLLRARSYGKESGVS